METFSPQGTCSRQILFKVDDNGILQDLKFLGGCTGALQVLARFAIGKPIAEIIDICDGIKCKNETSCPEQLALALRQYIERKQNEALGISNEPRHRRGHPRTLPTH
ncbi:MAG: TSCPD domain-containing protein [Clostridia bacterium]|mgnify:CR=1 FL=1|nr:TSCPD domain-containing protein [Clostridia bacterium]